MFSQGGYNGSIDNFKQLIASNPNALNDSYEIFKSGGYSDDIESFKTLMGVSDPFSNSFIKKKSPGGVSISADGSSESQGAESFMSIMRDVSTKQIAEDKEKAKAVANDCFTYLDSDKDGKVFKGNIKFFFII